MAAKTSRVDSEDVSQFLIKIMFFCLHLEEMRIFIPNLEERVFL